MIYDPNLKCHLSHFQPVLIHLLATAYIFLSLTVKQQTFFTNNRSLLVLGTALMYVKRIFTSCLARRVDTRATLRLNTEVPR